MSSYLDLFDYDLPESLVAQDPLVQRDQSKLLVVNRATRTFTHKLFFELVDLLTDNDVLVLNQSKVFPARLFGVKETGGKVEVLMVMPMGDDKWKVISKPGIGVGTKMTFGEVLSAEVLGIDEKTGERELQLISDGADIEELLAQIGKTPTPGYIQTSLTEEQLRNRYQTVYARITGSVAAPTAGLHFTPELLQKLKEKGVRIEYVTLHVGLGTFQGVREENLARGELHTEQFHIDSKTMNRLNDYKKEGKRIIAVGTTSTRTLETAVNESGVLERLAGETKIFIKPPYKFKFIDSMITNFHIPRSSLLMLISAFTTTPNTEEIFVDFNSSFIGQAYQKAMNHDYRFFSFGDAMFIS
jgi:S-adenosylmethionine:tRNA ribosyltransferase-isomerase